LAAVTPIRAAGGVVWRAADPAVSPSVNGSREVCVVHRPRYDDWSLPKGKLEPGEHPMVAAVREVAEEADVRAVPQVRLPPVRYAMRDGTPKLVDYWSMRAVETGGFQLHTEVDELRWVPVETATRLVTYAHDVRVLRDFAALPTVTTVLGFARHGHAGKRGTWSAPDTTRPLDAVGLVEAWALAPLLAVIRPERLLSASARRCVQTLDPLADMLDLPIEVDSSFDEPVPGQNGDENALVAAARLAELALDGTPAAVCSQGKVMPEALARLSGGSPEQFTTAKGTAWLLAFSGDRLVATDRLVPPT
jgi:8-oxo-dGTP pyrophosphatase MutT (NUDIX family)/broad specificity phosphatase PhoE